MVSAFVLAAPHEALNEAALSDASVTARALAHAPEMPIESSLRSVTESV